MKYMIEIYMIFIYHGDVYDDVGMSKAPWPIEIKCDKNDTLNQVRSIISADPKNLTVLGNKFRFWFQALGRYKNIYSFFI